MIHREFLLVNDTAWKHCVNFVEANRKALEADSPIRLIVTTQEEKRRSEQNRYYWKCVIGSIADQIWVDGKQFSKDAWHELLAGMYGAKEDIRLPNGQITTKRLSTTEMSVKQFSKYIDDVIKYGASEHGVMFPAEEQ